MKPYTKAPPTTKLRTRYVLEVVVDDDGQPEPLTRRELYDVLKGADLRVSGITIRSVRVQHSLVLPIRRKK